MDEQKILVLDWKDMGAGVWTASEFPHRLRIEEVFREERYDAYADNLRIATRPTLTETKYACELWLSAECRPYIRLARAFGLIPPASRPSLIETAPTDGEPVLVNASQGGWIEAYWDEDELKWMTDHHCDWFSDLNPTHFYPLPPLIDPPTPREVEPAPVDPEHLS